MKPVHMRKIIVWPAYLNLKNSRSMGRRVPRHLAIENPSIEEIFKAAIDLNLSPEIVNKAYPKNWLEVRKAIVMNKKESKLKTLKEICLKIKQYRTLKHKPSRSNTPA
ncbi:MAG: signal recognition particle subunit SRP19/SEC65 family protein [Candidatus Methanomethylicia archaeon]